MTATLAFDLLEEREEFERAVKGVDWHCALCDMDNYLHERIKHDDSLSSDAADALQATRHKLHECLEERGLCLW